MVCLLKNNFSNLKEANIQKYKQNGKTVLSILFFFSWGVGVDSFKFNALTALSTNNLASTSFQEICMLEGIQSPRKI